MKNVERIIGGKSKKSLSNTKKFLLISLSLNQIRLLNLIQQVSLKHVKLLKTVIEH